MSAAALTAVALTAVAICGATPLGAQGSRRVDPSAAELSIAVGELDAAEAALHEQVRRTPRDPSSRGSLGAYLAARGKFLVGATLLEEARFFGGDSISIEARLLEVFRWTGQYDRAAALTRARLPREVRESMQRAAETAVGGAAVDTVALQPNELFGLGRITITVGTEQIEADIQPLMTGLQMPSTMALFSALELVGARGDTTYGVARSVAIGAVKLGPIPVTLAPGLRVARIGFDVLSLLRPTFDSGEATLTVRTAAYEPQGRRLPLLLTFPGVSFFPGSRSGSVLLHTAAGRAALRGTRWTLDVPGGAIVIER
ncbi:MAG: hypothetical protein O2973_01140 [Gemmatimonadetes bacterium]|nr:hypothetical protein [Gemmatimonadota bacterium]